MHMQKVTSLGQLPPVCKGCNLAALCLPMGLHPEVIERLGSIVKRSRPLHRGDHLFRTEDPLNSLFIVKTGSVKTYAPAEDGSEQVLGFHLPGDIVGLDAIQQSKHRYSARVLETSGICEIPFERLEHLASTIPSLQHQLYRLLSKKIGNETDMLLLLGKKNAEERLASFLLNLSEQVGKRGFSSTDFHLSMSRNEIGSYLGLAVETVSRLFSRFQDEGALRVERKHIQLTDIDQLQAIVRGKQRQEQCSKVH